MEVALLAHEYCRGVESDTIDICGNDSHTKLLQHVIDNFNGHIKVDKEKFMNSFKVIEGNDGFEILDANARKFLLMLEDKLREFKDQGPEVQAFQVWQQIGKYDNGDESDVEEAESEKEESGDSDDEDYDVEMGEEEEDEEEGEGEDEEEVEDE